MTKDQRDVLTGIGRCYGTAMATSSGDGSREYNRARDALLRDGLIRVEGAKIRLTDAGIARLAALADAAVEA